ncbi:MAG: hypothetical protein FJ034_03870, partial [Chloroflexi bacterium]|nr:hypothetical protein [Chloroflexota bacterium]
MSAVLALPLLPAAFVAVVLSLLTSQAPLPLPPLAIFASLATATLAAASVDRPRRIAWCAAAGVCAL